MLSALWRHQDVTEQVFTVPATKEVFNLDNPYMAGELTVYYNGLKAIKGYDYQEVNPYTIRFLTPCEAGDTVICVIRKV